MAPQSEKSQLKRTRGSLPESDLDAKKPRRSERISPGPNEKTPVSNKHQLPSPVTRDGDSDEIYKEPTATPPEGRPSQVNHREKDDASQALNNISSPPQDTQAFSQYPQETKDALSDEVEDEVKEGVWGYLFPLDTKYGKVVVMKKRAACPLPDTVEAAKELAGKDQKGKSTLQKEEEAYERTKVKGVASGGYLIGRHPECDIVVDDPIVSNRHCLIFSENKGGDHVAIVEDLSSNGTFVNEANVGLDLIDSMLVVDPERRFTVDQCLNHPWMTQNQPGVNDSTDGLVGGIQGLDVHRRGVTRERTLLSSLNSVQVATRPPVGDSKKPVHIYAKNTKKMTPKEVDPHGQRNVSEFVEMGGKGDQPLFGADGESIYSKEDISGGKTKNGER
ncbi:serine threonine-protein kinase chk2 [Colletotrichum incanum]|uniref:Serine threonine-protein kinase chk2 n=1 Tax=Colletotrichum incanum TaxID=1573173 RepID=A0A167DL14_COLIC|nr:serine threonine-protein kinase chk2 [Colletotrichum incanum]